MKHIDIHKDYILYSLLRNVNNEICLTCNRMQEKTKYGETYTKAFEQYQKLLLELDIWEDLLAKCQEDYE